MQATSITALATDKMSLQARTYGFAENDLLASQVPDNYACCWACHLSFVIYHLLFVSLALADCTCQTGAQHSLFVS